MELLPRHIHRQFISEQSAANSSATKCASCCCLQGGMCTLFVPDQDKVISVASEHLEPVCPEKGDRVSLFAPFIFSTL